MLDAELCAEVFRQLVFSRKRPPEADALREPEDPFQRDSSAQAASE